MAAPVIKEMVRQHAEMAAFLWTVYDEHLLHPDMNPDMDEERLGRLTERLNAHLDGLRVAGPDGVRTAQDLYGEYPERGELFVVRMLLPNAPRQVADIDVPAVRRYLTQTLS